MPPQENSLKISAIRLNLEALLVNNYPFFKECSIIHVIKALNLRKYFYIVSNQFIEIN